MAAFILVHGTFARQAAWTRPDSPLSLALAAEAARHGEPARLRPVPWSGKNLERDRIRAATLIGNEIRKCQTDHPGEAIFLVGHSHGGSSIAYFLKLDTELRDKIAGCAFLSTPFVALRLRPLWESWFVALLVGVGSVATFLVALIAFYFFDYLPGLRDRPELVILAALALVVAGTISILIIQRLYGSRIKEHLRVTLPRRIAASETAALPDGQYLFLRTTGDEAASVLGAGQFFGWAMARLSERFNRLILHARAALTTRNRYGSWVLSSLKIMLIVAMSALYFAFSFLVVMAIAFAGTEFDTAWSVLNPVNLISEVMTGKADAPSVVILLALLFFAAGIAAYSLIVIAALLLSALALRLFGWTSLLEAIFADFAVEPMPYGQHSFVNVDWKESGPDEFGLNHSRSYLNPDALKCLGAWVGQRLADRSRKAGLP